MPKCTTVDVQLDATTDLANDIRAKLKGSYPVTKTGLAIGSTTTNIANAAFDYTSLGVQYSQAADAVGAAPGTDVVPQSTYGAVSLDVDSAGTVTAVSAADNATGYASAELAVAGIPDPSSGSARMGTVSVIKSDGDFTFGTTGFDDANTTEVYTDGETAYEAIGDAVS